MGEAGEPSPSLGGETLVDMACDDRAEQAVLGCILHTKGGAFTDLGELQSEHFYKPVNGMLYLTLRQMYDGGEDIDSLTLFGNLKESRELLRAGGAPYISDLLQAFKSSQNVSSYAQLVINAWRLRQVHGLGQRLIAVHDEYNPSDVPEALEQVRKFLEDSERVGEDSPSSGYPEWQEWYNDDSQAIPTPWGHMNMILAGGMHRGRLYVIGGRPGAGKSVFGANCMTQCMRAGYKGLMFSLEMSKAECLSRIYSSLSSVPLQGIFTKSLSADEKHAIHRVASDKMFERLEISEDTQWTIEDIARYARAVKKSRGLDVICIDHSLLLTQTNPKASEFQHVSHVAKNCKLLAKRLDCAVILLQQLNRGPENGEARRARMADLYGGGERDADVVIVLTPDRDSIAAQVIKNRTGKNNETVMLSNEFHLGRFGYG